MSRSKRDIFDTERMLERLTSCLADHGGNTAEASRHWRADAQALRRISMTLHTWHELECGNETGLVTRDEATGKPLFHVYKWNVGYRKGPQSIPDREAGALKRLKAIMARYPKLQAYVQGDPRGCALYILKPGDVPEGEKADAYYSRGLAVFK